MAFGFTPRLDILPLPQRRLWDEFSAVPPEFMLYRGTALALHLGHRQSVDFDFFGNKPLDPARLVPVVSFLADAIVTQREPEIFSCAVDRGGLVKLAAHAIYGAQFNPQSTLKALSYFDDGNLHRLSEPVKVRLVKAAREVDLDSLPAITVAGRTVDPGPDLS
jgi:hypothetical protein